MRHERCERQGSSVPLNQCARHRETEPRSALSFSACKCLKETALLLNRYPCAIVAHINAEHLVWRIEFTTDRDSTTAVRRRLHCICKQIEKHLMNGVCIDRRGRQRGIDVRE